MIRNLILMNIFLLLVSCNNKNYDQSFEQAHLLYEKDSLDQAISILYQIKENAEESNDFYVLKKAYNAIVEMHQVMGNLDSSYYYQILSINIKEKQNDYSGLAVSYIDLGNYYYRKNAIQLALDSYLKSKNYGKKINDSTIVNTSLQNIALCYLELEDYNESLKILEKTLTIALEKNIEDDLNNIFHNIGIIKANLDDDNFKNYFIKSLRYSDTKLDSLVTESTMLHFSEEDKEIKKEKFLEYKEVASKVGSKLDVAFSNYYLSLIEENPIKQKEYYNQSYSYFNSIDNYTYQKKLLMSQLDQSKSKMKELTELHSTEVRSKEKSFLNLMDNHLKILNDNYEMETKIYHKNLMLISVSVILFIFLISYLLIKNYKKKKKISDQELLEIQTDTFELRRIEIENLKFEITNLLLTIDKYAIITDEEKLTERLDNISKEANQLINKTDYIIRKTGAK